MKFSTSQNDSRPRFKVNAEVIISVILIIGAVAGAVTFSVIAAKRSLTNLEAVLLQAFALGASILGSFIFGRQSARTAAREMVKPHARSAFRRLWSLYQSISRLAQAIEESKRINFGSEDAIKTNYGYLRILEAIVTEQLSTADDALEDWRDLIPEDVRDVERRIKERSNIKDGAKK